MNRLLASFYKYIVAYMIMCGTFVYASLAQVQTAAPEAPLTQAQLQATFGPYMTTGTFNLNAFSQNATPYISGIIDPAAEAAAARGGPGHVDFNDSMNFDGYSNLRVFLIEKDWCPSASGNYLNSIMIRANPSMNQGGGGVLQQANDQQQQVLQLLSGSDQSSANLQTQASLPTTQQQLSTGLRINSASDNASGQQLSSGLQIQTSQGTPLNWLTYSSPIFGSLSNHTQFAFTDFYINQGVGSFDLVALPKNMNDNTLETVNLQLSPYVGSVMTFSWMPQNWQFYLVDIQNCDYLVATVSPFLAGGYNTPGSDLVLLFDPYNDCAPEPLVWLLLGSLLALSYFLVRKRQTENR
jgi:hypothetical protein